MATTACFIIVSRNDIPIYEAEVGVAAKVLFNLLLVYGLFLLVDSCWKYWIF
jgi:hypothetical protein